MSELRVSQGVLDDTVDEAQSNGVFLHLRVIQIVEQESGTLLDDDGVVASVEWSSRLDGDGHVEGRCGEQVAAHEDELHEDLLQLEGVGVDDFIFLESFKFVKRGARDIAARFVAVVFLTGAMA